MYRPAPCGDSPDSGCSGGASLALSRSSPETALVSVFGSGKSFTFRSERCGNAPTANGSPRVIRHAYLIASSSLYPLEKSSLNMRSAVVSSVTPSSAGLTAPAADSSATFLARPILVNAVTPDR
ncbi:MAG: hypothetical protein HQK85_07455 [Nitrospinae bacterium]|nr:hypothetical protein [Nitrospinota bacterium]